MKIFITLFMIFALVMSLSLGVDDSAKEMQDQAFDRALVSFGLAKGLNAVISLLQGTELSFTPVGVGVNFSVGEILDPFNDMVERFSWIMLFATVSIGIQKIVLTLSSTLFMQVALLLSVATSLTLLWVEKFKHSNIIKLSLKMFTFFLILRFSAVVFVYLSATIHTSVLEGEYMQASQVVENTRVELDNLNNKNKLIAKEQKEEGFFSGLSSKYDEVLENLNISKQLESMHESIENASNNIIKLITVFVVETILLPLLYFWLLLLLFKWIFNVKIDAITSKVLYNNSINNEGIL